MSDEVLTEERDGVLVVTLNRPQARNAVNEVLARSVAEAMDRLDEEDVGIGHRSGQAGSRTASASRAAAAARPPSSAASLTARL